MKQALKYFFLWITGGVIYIGLEMLYRGYSHWTMFVLGGICFVILGLINEVIPWNIPIWQQMFIGACIVTILEFFTGCIVNLWLLWGVWDYSNMPGNIMGQICPSFFLIWLLVSLSGIILDDWLRYWLWGEERPHYSIF